MYFIYLYKMNLDWFMRLMTHYSEGDGTLGHHIQIPYEGNKG